MQNDKDLSTWQTFRRLWPIIAPFKAGLIVAAVALVLNAGSDTFMLSLLKPLLDDGFGKTDRSVLLWMPLVVIGLMVLRGITSYISSYCISRVSGKVVMTMRRRLFGHMMGMPVAFFDKQSTGTLLSRITYDSEQVALFFQRADHRGPRRSIDYRSVRDDVLLQLAAVADPDRTGADCVGGDPRGLQAFSQYQ